MICLCQIRRTPFVLGCLLIIILLYTFPYHSLRPNSLFYPAKTLSEKIELFLSKDDNKNVLIKRNYQRRFEELVYIIDSEKMGFLEEVVNRYNSYIGGRLLTSSDPGLQADAKKYFDVLSKARDRYPANSPYWLKIQEAVEVTRKLL